MKQITSIALAGLLCASIVGCGTTAKFVYPADGRNLTSFTDGPAYQKKVAVTPFEDMRGDKNQFSTMFLYLIPAMPFGWIEYERPDAARSFSTINEFDFDASEDLAKAAAYSLRKSGLFQDAFFTFGGDKEKADYLLQGEMLSTTYKGSHWTYGVSIFCPYLWLVGLPIGTSRNELIVSMKMTDLSTGRPVWEKTYELEHKVTQGFYYNFGDDVRGYSHLMQQVMNDAVNDMNRKLQHTQGQ